MKLVERIVNTGVNCVTIHCRTRSMRKTERARTERLKEIVDFVRGLGKDVAVVQNGDCIGHDDARRIRAMTGEFMVHISSLYFFFVFLLCGGSNMAQVRTPS